MSSNTRTKSRACEVTCMATSVRIQHNGQELGPYPIEDVRRMVLSGEIPAGSPGELDNSGEWRPLHQHPEFAARSPSPAPIPPAGAALSTGAAPVLPGEEATLWSGSPSQILNFKVFLGWLLLLCLAGAALYFLDQLPSWSDHVTRQQAMIGFGALCLVGLLHCILAALKLRSTHYLVTTQRVRVTRGLLGKDTQEIELFRVKDTAASQTFFQRLFGVGDINIVSGDTNNPNLHLAALPNAVDLRERIRQEVMTLRQRFGVRELDVM